jgi:5-methylcytosine-specific restriction endonuclease McrA
MAERGCSIEGCERPHRARGYCSTHYNQLVVAPERRHRKTLMRCGYCNEPIFKAPTTKFIARFCDETCRDLWRIEHDINPRPSQPGRARPMVTVTPIPATQRTKECRLCGSSFVGRRRTYCSKRCADRVKSQRDGGRHRRRRIEVFERDGWTCHLCGEQTDPNARVPDELAPTIDHVIPRSLGGSDEPANLRTAHWLCNTLRGVTPVEDYLTA